MARKKQRVTVEPLPAEARDLTVPEEKGVQGGNIVLGAPPSPPPPPPMPSPKAGEHKTSFASKLGNFAK